MDKLGTCRSENTAVELQEAGPAGRRWVMTDLMRSMWIFEPVMTNLYLFLLHQRYILSRIACVRLCSVVIS